MRKRILTCPDDYQRLALRTLVKEQDTDTTMKMCAFGLSGEVGEIIAIRLMGPDTIEQQKAKLYDEMGDLLWYAVIMGDCIGTSFHQLLDVSYDEIDRNFMTPEFLGVPIGRINDVIKKYSYHHKGQRPFPVGVVEQNLAELIDRISWIAHHSLRLTIMDIAEGNIEKLAQRHGSSFQANYSSDSVKE